VRDEEWRTERDRSKGRRGTLTGAVQCKRVVVLDGESVMLGPKGRRSGRTGGLAYVYQGQHRSNHETSGNGQFTAIYRNIPNMDQMLLRHNACTRIGR